MEARTSAPPNHLAELYLPLGGENKNLGTSFASIFLFHLTYNTQPSSITYPAVEEHLCLYYWWTMLRGRSLSSWEPKERNSEYLCHAGSCTQEHQEEVMVPHASIAVGLHGEDEGSIYWLPISVQRRLGKWQLSHTPKGQCSAGGQPSRAITCQSSPGLSLSVFGQEKAAQTLVTDSLSASLHTSLSQSS